VDKIREKHEKYKYQLLRTVQESRQTEGGFIYIHTLIPLGFDILYCEYSASLNIFYHRIFCTTGYFVPLDIMYQWIFCKSDIL
jgi:hypothetical protein